MKALYLNAYGPPSAFILGDLEKPEVSQPDHTLIKVHAASLNPIDIITAGGALKLMRKETFPFRLGFDVSGTVEAAGADSKFKVGEQVIARVPENHRGTFAEYVLTTDKYLAKKPQNLSFEEAAALPLVALTSLQAFRRAGDLKGKQVLVPAALGGAGSTGIQVAKALGAIVTTTASTGKVERAKSLFSDVEIIDYKKEDPTKRPATFDFIYDTIGQAAEYMPLLKKGGLMVSISSMPSGAEMKERMPDTPWYIVQTLNAINWWKYDRTATSLGINYSYLFMYSNGKDLQELAHVAEEGKLRPVVGEVIDFHGEGAEAKLRDACERQKSGAGAKDGGKFVFKMV